MGQVSFEPSAKCSAGVSQSVWVLGVFLQSGLQSPQVIIQVAKKFLSWPHSANPGVLLYKYLGSMHSGTETTEWIQSSMLASEPRAGPDKTYSSRASMQSQTRYRPDLYTSLIQQVVGEWGFQWAQTFGSGSGGDELLPPAKWPEPHGAFSLCNPGSTPRRTPSPI